MYFDQGTSFPEHKWKSDICLGPSDNVGNEMSQWVNGISMVPIPCQAVWALTPDEDNNFTKLKESMLDLIYSKFGLCLPLDADTNPTAKEEVIDGIVPRDSSNPNLTANLDESPADLLIDAEVLFPNSRGGNESKLRFVQNLNQDPNGQTIGAYYSNPLMNT